MASRSTPTEHPERSLRADARRNIEAILEAAAASLSRNPDATLAQIAEAAGVGRITLYGHFPSRSALIEAVLAREVEAGETVLAGVDLSGDPRHALARLVSSSWQQIERVGSVTIAAEEALAPERILQVHARPAARVDALVERGRAAGVFRTDLPTQWLVTTLHRVMHGAAEDLHAGRLTPEAAVPAIVGTILAAYTAPGGIVPDAASLLR